MELKEAKNSDDWAACCTAKTKNSDWAAGRRDAAGGYYDKWYRYNRLDEGAAYDAGHKTLIKPDAGCWVIEGR